MSCVDYVFRRSEACLEAGIWQFVSIKQDNMNCRKEMANKFYANTLCVCDKAPDIAFVQKLSNTPLVFLVLPCHEQFICTKPV